MRKNRTQYHKAWYAANKEQVKASNKAKYEANKERAKEYAKAWRKANPDQVKESQRAYQKANLGKFCAYNVKRRATKLNATPYWLTIEQLKEIEAFYVLANQLELQDGIKYHVDHIIPLQGETVSGLHVPWNLQVITASENIKKSNKLNSSIQ